jgi:hypothetical protein
MKKKRTAKGDKGSERTEAEGSFDVDGGRTPYGDAFTKWEKRRLK